MITLLLLIVQSLATGKQLVALQRSYADKESLPPSPRLRRVLNELLNEGQEQQKWGRTYSAAACTIADRVVNQSERDILLDPVQIWMWTCVDTKRDGAKLGGQMCSLSDSVWEGTGSIGASYRRYRRV